MEAVLKSGNSQIRHQSQMSHAHVCTGTILPACKAAIGETLSADSSHDCNRVKCVVKASPGPGWRESAKQTRRHSLASPAAHAKLPSLGALPQTASLAQTLQWCLRLYFPSVPQKSPLLSPRHGSTDQSFPSASEREGLCYQYYSQALLSHFVSKHESLPAFYSWDAFRRIHTKTCP